MHQSVDNKSVLPQPFNETVWTKALRPAAQALWQWHRYLAEPVVYRHGEAGAFFEEESVRAAAGQPLRLLPQPVVEAAYETCRAHNLPRALLADQVKASAGFQTAMRFETYAALQAFIQPWAGSQGRLLARLAGHKGSWQRRSSAWRRTAPDAVPCPVSGQASGSSPPSSWCLSCVN